MTTLHELASLGYGQIVSSCLLQLVLNPVVTLIAVRLPLETVRLILSLGVLITVRVPLELKNAGVHVRWSLKRSPIVVGARLVLMAGTPSSRPERRIPNETK